MIFVIKDLTVPQVTRICRILREAGYRYEVDYEYWYHGPYIQSGFITQDLGIAGMVISELLDEKILVQRQLVY